MKIIPISSKTNREGVKEENSSQDNQIDNSNQRSMRFKNWLKSNKRIWIPLLVLIILAILAIIGIVVYIVIIKNSTKENNEKNFIENIVLTEVPKEEVDDGVSTPDLGPLKVEFSVKTKIDDLRKIRVEQISKEKNIINGELEENLVYRITYYDIIFFKEKNSQDYQKKYFNKTYTGSIAIAKECISMEKEECEPDQLIDLNYQDINNSRNLEEINDLKDLPILLCLFEITENDVIMSILCPESLSKGRKDSIVLDLYFFKPPSIERPNKSKGNVNINIEEKEDKKYVRMTDIGMCSIKNPYLSNCTTDFNLTTDLEGNVLNYDELCFSNITKDNNNYYIKNKVTKLLDVTNNYNNSNVDKYKENLNKFLPLLNPYMKYEQLFNFTQFKQLYNTAKNATSESKERRYLENNINETSILQKATIFTYSDKGTDYNINLRKNPGIYEDYFEYLNNFEAGQNNYNLVRLRQNSNFDDILKKLSTLSKAGNKLASILYENIKSDFNILDDIINENITSLNKLVVYQEILKLFDSSLSITNLTSLPFEAVEFSDYLSNQLYNTLNNIMNDDMKKHIENFKDNINIYIRKTHELVFQIEDNLKNLMNSLSSKKSALTEISTYYLNNTQSSYFDIIIKIEDILLNYYKNESNFITTKVENLFKTFEKNLINSIKSHREKLDDLLPKLEDKSIEIESGNEDDSQKIVTDLKNANNYISEIISQIKEKIWKTIGLKDNNYFLSNDEINENNNTFTSMLSNAIDVAKKLDNDEYIDKIFDIIMTNFKNSFTEANKNIEKIKEQIFTLTENDYFSLSDQKAISSDIKDLYFDISLKLQKENNFYLENLNKKLDNFLEQNEENLKSIINNLTILFSEEKLNTLADLYNKGFENSSKIIENQLKENTNLAKNYFDDIMGVITNNSKIIETLYNYAQSNTPYYREYWSDTHYVYLNSHSESISSKKLTKGFINKYTKFKNNAINSLDYLEDDIFLDFLNEYKKPITELKKLLQSIKNTKISDLYPDYKGLKFTDDNIEKIDILYTRLNQRISDKIFNQEYAQKIIKLKNIEIPKATNIKKYIEDNIGKIQYNEIISDINNDFCYSFLSKAYYTCNNGQLNYYIDNNFYYCLHSAKYSENYKNIKDISIYNNEYINSFINEYKKFYSLIEKQVSSYVSIMNNLKNELLLVKQETLNKKITQDYLLPFENKINNLLLEKYDDNIIESSYDFYKNDTETKIESILKNIGDNWNNIFDKLNNEIKEKENELKSGTYEFGIMAQITSILINNNITKNFYKSIINHQKNEFTYSISYYYNFLLRNIKSAEKYILSVIPSNLNGFNDIIDLRKNEIQDYFEDLIKKITELKEKSCSVKRQAEVLQVDEEDFFGINDILYKNIKEINKSLSMKAVYPYSFDLLNSEYSFINRFYLENSLIGSQLKKIYEEIEDKSFIKLKFDEYINLVKKNFLFDKNEFINKIKEIIDNLELNIEKKYLKEQKKEYISKLESIITKQIFTKDRMIQEITDLYKKGVAKLEQNKIQKIKENINKILIEIKKYLSSEAYILQTTSNTLAKNDSKILNTLNEYKKEIFNKLNSTLLKVINEFHEEITEKLLNNYVEPMFETFLNKSIQYISSFEERNTLNETYNTKKIILDIVKDICTEYRNITEMQIEFKYNEYVNNIKDESDLYGIQKIINDEIEKEYNLTLKPALIKVSRCNLGDQDCIEYDFDDGIKNKIEKTINLNIEKINDIVLETRDYKLITIVNQTGSTIEAISLFKISLPSWEFCFDEIQPYIDISNSLEVFISSEYSDEIITFKNSLGELFNSYFNELISEIILSFGNDFFDRIINFNENFKITGLYNNLKYSIFQTISYYIMINMVEEIDELPRELKLKLYNLNNINLIAQQKNKKVLDYLEDNIDEFIEESKQKIITHFSSNIEEYIIKENIFNNIANNILKEKLNDMRKEEIIGNTYKDLLNENFKKKFINSYTKSMNRQLEELLEIISDQKEQLKVEMDYCFTLEPEEVLNDINDKLNITVESINEYSDYSNSFNISEDFSNYLNNYGYTKIQPSYEKIISLIDESTKNIILNTIDTNTKIYEQNLNAEEFNNLSNMTYSSVKEIYEKVKTFVNNYGIKEYNDNLENEIERLTLRNIRRLNGRLTEEDMQEEIKENIDKGISEIFEKLLGYSEHSKIFLNGFEELNYFKNNISEYFDNLDQSFNKSKNLIKNNKYEEDIEKNLIKKLDYLKNISSNYYNSINETFYNLISYLNSSISDIYELLNQCENATYKAFSEKYENISKQVHNLDQNISGNEEISPVIHNSTWENNDVITTATFNNIAKKGKFKFYYKFEKGSDPIMRAELIDECKPEKLTLEIEEQIGECGKNVQEIIAKFNNISFITYIDYNIVKNEINMTTIKNFESYDYDIYKYKMGTSSGSACKTIMGVPVCTNTNPCKQIGTRTHNTTNQEKVYTKESAFFNP